MSRKRAIVASAVDLTAGMQAVERLRAVAVRDREKTAPWYSFTAQDASTTEVMIYAEIGEWGVTALDFVAELRQIRTPNITVRLNSPGGAIFDGFAIYNALLNHPARVVARIEGVAASAASFIAQAADEIEADEASTMMVHGGSGMCIGKAADMREMADLLDKLDSQMAGIYAQRTERPREEWLAQMGVDTWYTAEEAVAAGLVDRLTSARVTARTGGVVTGLALVGENGPEGVSLDTTQTTGSGVEPAAGTEPLDLAGLREALKGVFA